VRSLNEELFGWRMLRSVWRYLIRRRGVFASPAAEFTAYFRSENSQPHADLQVYGLPITGDVEATVARGADPRPERFAGYTLAPNQLRPYSRGWVRLRSADPGEAPAIRMNYLADERDRRALLAGLRWLRRMAAQPALAGLTEVETRPGPGVETDAAWLEYAAGHLSSGHHAVGSCRIGPSGDARAVVDPELRVHGIERLRVADASVIPSITSGNTNAICVAIGEKCSDLVLGRSAPPLLELDAPSP